MRSQRPILQNIVNRNEESVMLSFLLKLFLGCGPSEPSDSNGRFWRHGCGLASISGTLAYPGLALSLRSGWFADGRFLGRVLDEWGSDTQEFIRLKLPHLVVAAVIGFALFRVLSIITTRMVRIAEAHAAAHSRIAQVRTMAGVIRATGLTIIAAIVAMQFLAAIGVNLAPLLASAGVAGVAIGLAAQNIVRDMLNGILILLEDQFNVGETIRIAGVSGVVESMTLRKTTLRDGDGTLYVIPNSQITTVANMSADYSVATVNVSVDFSANPDKVTDLLKNIAMGVRNSDDFKDTFIAD